MSKHVLYVENNSDHYYVLYELDNDSGSITRHGVSVDKSGMADPDSKAEAISLSDAPADAAEAAWVSAGAKSMKDRLLEDSQVNEE